MCLFSFLLILEPSSRNSGFAGIRLVRVEVSSETGGGLAPHFLSLVMLFSISSLFSLVREFATHVRLSCPCFEILRS